MKIEEDIERVRRIVSVYDKGKESFDRLVAMTPQWQPIETAPASGEFLAYGHPEMGISQSGYKTVFGIPATHWMPLPKPPTSHPSPDHQPGE